METEYEKYKKDTRIPCKYGVKCYQKNPAHHEKYKHPPKKNVRNSQPSRKKFKAENRTIVTVNTSSDSDSQHDSDSQSEDLQGSNSESSKKAPGTEDTKVNGDSEANSESAFPTKNENQKINNDVSSSDDETLQVDSNNFKKDNGEVSSASKLGDEDKSNEFHHEDKSSGTEKKTGKTGIKEWANFIKEKFLVSMPEDFYQFWDFCKKIKPINPSESLKEIGLTLVGPFDVLAGKFSRIDNKTSSDYLIHWRYYRDPPELQTVLKSDDPTGYHIGYFRDSPDDLPVFLASNSPKKNGILTQMGANIFTAVNIFLEDLKKSGNPFKKLAIGKIQFALVKEAERLGIDMSKKTKEIINREKKIVTRTFNKIGLVVPYEKKSQQGYRELALNDKDLEKLLTKLQNAKTENEKQSCLSSLQPVFTYASIAADECDFGTGIELGWNIISHGIESLNATAERFLVTNYKLLNREAFAKIAEAHMKNRKQSVNLSIV